MQWTRRESNPDFRHASRRVIPLDHRPAFVVSGPPGTRTPITWVQTKRLPFGPAALTTRGPSGSRTRSSSLPRRCAAETPTDHRVIPAGIEPALSWLSPRRLCHWTTGSFRDRGGSRTHKHEALDLAALPVCVPGRWRVRGSHPAVPAYEAGLDSGPPASCRPRHRAGHTDLMRANWAPAAPAISDHGESRTPTALAGSTF